MCSLKKKRHPVALIFFNRKECLKKVASRILEADPPILYLISDGPRESVDGERELCSEIREMVEQMPWKCPVIKIYSEQNLGCGKRVSSGITEVFEHEESAIILEDDVLPHLDFFKYCDELLNYYWNDESVFMISGLQKQERIGTNNGYCFNFHNLIWGWATWRRAWRNYVFDTSGYFNDKDFVNSLAPIRYGDSLEYTYQKLERTFLAFQNKLDTWDSQWGLCQIRNRAYCISPNWSLVENLGFDAAATHTKDPDGHWGSRFRSFPFDFPIKHPAPGILATATKFLDNRNPSMAISCAEEGISKYPFETRLYILLAMAAHSKGDSAKTRKGCEDALQIDPDNKMATFLLSNVV